MDLSKTLKDKVGSALDKNVKSNSKSSPGQSAGNLSSGYSVPERIWNFLCNEKSLGSVATAAIMGNIQAESTYNPSSYNDSAMKQGRARTPAIGICQWLDGRYDALQSVASSKGVEWKDLEAQLVHLWNEIGPGGQYNKFLNELVKYGQERLDEAVEYWEKHFEVSGDVKSYPRRKNAAREALQKQGKGIIAAGNYTPGTTGGNNSSSGTGGYMGQPSAGKTGTTAVDDGYHYCGKTRHTDYMVKPIDPDKTFCEPIYPDLTSLPDEIPSYAIPSNIPTSEMQLKDGGGMPGLSYIIPTSSIISYSDTPDILRFNMFNQSMAEQRKQIFDANKHRKAVKVATVGKPPNNKDPFPVNAKVVELETHQPRIKIDKLKACEHSLSVARELVQLSTNTEKRIVKLENNMATLMRYLYRLAARVNINCVYYGGQSLYHPYKCIRCMQDDLVNQGAEVSLDQCLNCTRYEPLIGQTYDIFNDSLINLSQILDNQQTSLGTMEEYCKFVNLTEKQTPLQSAKVDTSTISTRNAAEADFDTLWGEGLKMDWRLYPVELQKPHINGEVEGGLLTSYQGTASNGGLSITSSPQQNLLIRCYEEINSIQEDGFGYNAKQAALAFLNPAVDETVAELKSKTGSDIRTMLQQKDVTPKDACLVGAIMKVYNDTGENVVNKLTAIQKKLNDAGCNNIALAVLCYALDIKYVLGDSDDKKLPVRLDKVKPLIQGSHSSEGNNGDDINNGQSNNSTNTVLLPTINWSSINSITWGTVTKTDTSITSTGFAMTAMVNQMDHSEAESIFGGSDSDNSSATTTPSMPSSVKDAFVNFAKVVFLYKEITPKCSASRFDTAEWGFPFTEEEITGGLGLNYSGYFNEPRPGHYHGGIDIGVGAGADSYERGGTDSQMKRVPIHAARDGLVYDIATFADNDGGGQQVYIKHADGYTSWYMHLSSFAVNKGDTVTRGQVIGYTGGSGKNNQMLAFPEHLHFEIHQPGEVKIDPASKYNGLAGTYPCQLADIKI